MPVLLPFVDARLPPALLPASGPFSSRLWVWGTDANSAFERADILAAIKSAEFGGVGEYDPMEANVRKLFTYVCEF